MNNIKSKFIATIVAIALVIMVLFFVGCCDNTNNSVKASDDMFVTVSENSDYSVVYDRETKIMYTMSEGPYNVGNFTVLLNIDGTPKLYKGE
jgi:hypothetical protein|nr:hypothetical protein [Ruminococcus sp. 1001270H_150608_F2]